jgi:ribose transport system permease protein
VTGRARPSTGGPSTGWRASITRALGPYGMLGVLLLLVILFSVLTVREQHPTGDAAAHAVAKKIAAMPPSTVVIFARTGAEDEAFANSLRDRLRARGTPVVGMVTGDPTDVKREIAALASRPQTALRIATLESYAPIVASILEQFPALSGVPVMTPPSYRWPTFLLRENLRNVANQIAVIAMVAVGMTMVIITGGIDLSVGSLIALAAVSVAGMIGWMGGTGAGAGAMILAGLGAIVVCGLFGLFSGFTITRFRVPPFIATLGIMQVASGLAYILSKGKPIYRLPDSFVTLGRSADPLLGIPYAVIVMAALFAVAHLLMSRTVLGRYIYAVGGNEEAARLAGVRVKDVLLFVYTISGLLAGFGGVVMASQLKSGAPTYGVMYELYVIAAVVVGGTSLSGGEGKILGTLIGAFIIAVIQNGMNLTNVESYTQKVVLGLVILGAVLIDRVKQQQGWWRWRPGRGAGI